MFQYVRPDGYRRAIIFPPAAPGSLGDEAIVLGCLGGLADAGYASARILDERPKVSWAYLGPRHRDMTLGYSRFRRDRDWYRPGLWLSRLWADHLLCLGADVMDGFYRPQVTHRRLALVTLAARSGLPATLAGFSFNAEPAPGIVEAFRALPASVNLCARDPVSASRLQDHLDRPVRTTADLAFLLAPVTETPAVAGVVQWLRAERDQGRTLVGVNANPLLCRGPAGLDPGAMVARYAELLASLETAGLKASLLLIPHDFRDSVNDLTLLEALHALLPPDLKAHARVVEGPIRGDEVKGICGELDFALSARMHLSIACLGQGVPVLALEYQGKFQGLFQHFGCGELVVTPQAFMASPAMAGDLAARIRDRHRFRPQILGLGPHVRTLARFNLDLPPASIPGIVPVRRPGTSVAPASVPALKR